MSSTEFSDRFYNFCLCGVALIFPFNQPYINYAIVLLAASFTLNLFLGSKTKPETRELFFLPILFYALHLAGLIYSANTSYGFADVQTKFSFLFFPLIFIVKPFDKTFNVNLKWCFIIGGILACVYNLATSAILYHTSKSLDAFYYGNFSKLMHPTYLTIYLNIAALLIVDLYFGKLRSKLLIFVLVLLFIVLMICIMLLSSRTAIFASYVTILLFTILKIKEGFNIRQYWRSGLIALVVIIVSGFLVLSHTNRFEQVEVLFNGDNDFYKFDKKEYNSATVRIPLWINAAEVIDNNKLLGVGTGDIKEALDSVYRKNKFAYAEAAHFSPHNQILHTGIILGFVGITLLLSMLLIPLYYSIRYKSYLLMCFIIIFFFNMMTESILERQAGIILFSFFYVMLIAELYEDIKKAGDLPA